jgi:peptidoglycan/LPS O-acetylase OafA/YrhL
MTVVKNENNYSNNIFSRLGKYTYGMYLYHPIILIFVKIAFDLFNLDYNSSIINFILAILSLALTIEISILSYNYIEKPFLNLKGKISTVKTRV